ncbi:phosphoglucomutase (alpha-D-glucose-1,6-bisphosphate-dependent) [Parenemella sanctibonifatiensis]|uniref:Phosphoglucomutase, alpha-D-glucose phosphate-specific n=1 Tax=Parenemella sanctibonifatiensis TaxID=2016505 RepID=A0A255E4Z4_9ACTN|nr:phosphoglucomutase (alpha-D-glucose-1,6-bisphosphate-dependent) [Parenemella sanctibonifatiensis]OYN86586.1 phosphoglucomutase, alpha-D-glucose phosphate-specific [Parenemella sanctibonifatiensis]
MAHERAGQPAREEDLIDVDAVLAAYTDLTPDPSDPDQQVVFGTSGHRGSSLDTRFNDAHIAAISQAIAEHRDQEGVTGPLYLAKDTHLLSLPAWRTAIEVLVANGVEVRADAEDDFTPTPALSRAIIRHNTGGDTISDGIVVTPSHNPPRDGGFKYNPPNGGPADSTATKAIAARANELLADPSGIRRISFEEASRAVTTYDFLSPYCDELAGVIDLDAIREAKLTIGADPMGGAAVQYWQRLADTFDLGITVVNPEVDPRWSFMTLDTDGKIRMDCSSPDAMASLVANRDKYDLATGNDADSDRHGIVTPDGGLMNPNAYLAVAIGYLFRNRPEWPSNAGVGKTLVSSSLIDKVAAEVERTLVEVPVGFKWFVDGLSAGTLGFGGEESAGASLLQRDGSTWTTDKDGIVMCLLAAEIIAVTGKSPSQLYAELQDRHGESHYARVDAAANREQKERLGNLSPEDVTATELAGEPITAVLSHAPGNDAAIGGIKVTTEHAWFAARPSGTEDKYKIYAESLLSADHLAQVQQEATALVDEVLGS